LLQENTQDYRVSIAEIRCGLDAEAVNLKGVRDTNRWHPRKLLLSLSVLIAPAPMHLSNYLFWEEINMPGLDLVLALPPMLGGLWAYGPAPGVELIPYFLGLAAWVGMAFLAVLLAPFSALLRRLRGNKNAPPVATNNDEPSDKTEPRA
jgi:hypothetical protein